MKSIYPLALGKAIAGSEPEKAARRVATALVFVLLSLGSLAFADSIVTSKHNLSTSGPGTIRAVSESEICIFCHTPHRASEERPLWNHALSSATYTPYQSSTIKASIGQPTGSSKLCLSCHDGTVALGMLHSRSTPIQMLNATTMPPGRSLIGTDLSDDHPVSFTYDSALASADGQLRDPATLTDRVRVDHNQQLQCTSCHDPHNNQYGQFLVRENSASALCITCHTINQWQTSAHSTSPATWNGAGVNPWPASKEKTVAGNACGNCHGPHGAATKVRLLNQADEEQNCYVCHSGNVASKNIAAEFNKISVHPITKTTGVHDPAEDPINAPRHVECADCHNPHAANSAPGVVPNASGALAVVKGVSSSGSVLNVISREYELCFRCHGDGLSGAQAYVNRREVQLNTRLEFSSSNPSYHPVVAPGKNSNVPSLIAPLTVSSLIYCTDCHNNNQGKNNGGSGPNGPHGSVYAPLLERQLLLTDFSTENTANYDLCYKCHSRDSILSDRSFPLHRLHVVEEKTSCTTCHDPHGVSGKSHLINFNVNYVTASSNGRLEFNDTGVLHGNCSLRCHGQDHRASPY